MNLPKGIEMKDGKEPSVLRLKKNLYGGRNSGLLWYEYLKAGLENIGFRKSNVDDYVFYKKGIIFAFYVDDGIFWSKDKTLINKTIGKLTDIKEVKKSLNIDDQGDIADYLGLNFEKLETDKIKMSQPHLVQQIIDEVGLTSRSYTKTVPAAPTKLLSRDPEQAREQEPFDYRRIIGKLNFLEKSSRPDLAYAVHQCARFSSDPREEHYDTVRYLTRYLLDTKDEGLIFDAKMKDSLSVWVGADFSGNWKRENVDVDESTAKSRTGYVIMLTGCPIH